MRDPASVSAVYLGDPKTDPLKNLFRGSPHGNKKTQVAPAKQPSIELEGISKWEDPAYNQLVQEVSRLEQAGTALVAATYGNPAATPEGQRMSGMLDDKIKRLNAEISQYNDYNDAATKMEEDLRRNPDKYDPQSRERLNAFYSAPTVQDKLSIMQEGILIPKEEPYNLYDETMKGLNANIEAEGGKYVKYRDGKKVSIRWEEVPPETVKGHLRSMISNNERMMSEWKKKMDEVGIDVESATLNDVVEYAYKDNGHLKANKKIFVDETSETGSGDDAPLVRRKPSYVDISVPIEKTTVKNVGLNGFKKAVNFLSSFSMTEGAINPYSGNEEVTTTQSEDLTNLKYWSLDDNKGRYPVLSQFGSVNSFEVETGAKIDRVKNEEENASSYKLLGAIEMNEVDMSGDMVDLKRNKEGKITGETKKYIVAEETYYEKGNNENSHVRVVISEFDPFKSKLEGYELLDDVEVAELDSSGESAYGNLKFNK